MHQPIDQVQRTFKGKNPVVTMIADVHSLSAHRAIPVFHVQDHSSELRSFRPTVSHGGLLPSGIDTVVISTDSPHALAFVRVVVLASSAESVGDFRLR
jgi:hypothetical protein